MLYNFLLEIEHDCSFSDFSQNHPKIEIQLWCNSHHDILDLKGEDSELEKAIIDLEEELGKITKIYPGQGHVQLVFELCECSKFPLDPIFDKYDSLELPPIKYFAGREIVNLLVTPEDAGLILEDIRRVDPDAKVNVLKLAPLKDVNTPYPLYLPLDDLKTSFTDKQLKALTHAYKKGYYELPRGIRLENLAEGMEIHRRTYEEHLRKAEKKIMSYLIPSLLL